MRIVFGGGASVSPAAENQGPKRIQKGTEQQERFWDAVLNQDRSVLLRARAGTGKSSSAREALLRYLDVNPRASVRYLCFNNSIATEFRGSVAGSAIDVSTIHSQGFACLRSAFGNLKVNAYKVSTLLRESPFGTNMQFRTRKTVESLVSAAKNACLPLDDEDQFYTELLEVADNLGIEIDERIIDQVLEASWIVFCQSADSFQTGEIDFDDMIWLPVVYGLTPSRADIVVIDEAQDLNRAQQLMVFAAGRSSRILVIGDDRQAIYGFRGADSNSLDTLASGLNALPLNLTVTFRCPKSHVEMAQQMVPDIEAHESNQVGQVNKIPAFVPAETLPGQMVLCRTNAPLVKACLRCLGSGVSARMNGREIGSDLENLAKQMIARIPGGVNSMAEFAKAVEEWESRKIAILSKKENTESKIEAVRDKAECVLALAEFAGSPADIPAVVKKMESDSGGRPVVFSSVHRAKGAESENVTILQKPWFQPRNRNLRDWEVLQRQNLDYVAVTRSKSVMNLVPVN